jgi:DNA replication and repair protein RecF
VNLLLGENGHGKTNFLEALNYFALGRSHRGARNDDLVGFEHSHLHVQLTVEEESDPEGEGGFTARTFEYGIERGGGRRFKIDGQAVTKRVDLVGKLATVFFSPDSVGLVRGSPEKRRRFVDQGIAGIDRFYLTHLQSYLRALRQKARLLRDLKRGVVPSGQGRRQLDAWNRKMAPHAARIHASRASYAGQIEPFANQAYTGLAAEDLAFEFTYKPYPANDFHTYEIQELEKEILAGFDYIVQDEIRRGRPLSGPHFDDFEVKLAGKDLRTFGSQGETRTAAISLILAKSDVVFQVRHVRPVLFFDDIFSELDRSRSRQLQEQSCRWHQVFIATARAEDVSGWQPEGLRVWEVKEGRLEAVA